MTAKLVWRGLARMYLQKWFGIVSLLIFNFVAKCFKTDKNSDHEYFLFEGHHERPGREAS